MAGYRARESWSVPPYWWEALGHDEGWTSGSVLSWLTVESMVSWSWRWGHALVSLALGVLESVLAHR